MSDKPSKPNDPGASYGGASSPYDQPTESLAPQTSATPGKETQSSRSVPRTDDELGFGGGEPHRTEKLQNYDSHYGDGSYGGESQKTEQFPSGSAYSDPKFADPKFANSTYADSDAVDPRYTDPGFASEPTQQFAPAGAVAAAPVAAPVAATTTGDTDRVEVREKRGTTDLGLLILRLAVGAIALVHGLQKLTGWWGGPGLDGFEELLLGSGFDQSRILATAGAVGEVAGGALLILGLATPLAAASIVAVMINAWCVRQLAEPGLQFFAPDGIEYETLLAVAAASIALTGPGRISFDGGRKWSRRPFIGSLLALIIGIAGGTVIWIFLNGANPLV